MGQPGNNVIWKITFVLKSASIIGLMKLLNASVSVSDCIIILSTHRIRGVCLLGCYKLIIFLLMCCRKCQKHSTLDVHLSALLVFARNGFF